MVSRNRPGVSCVGGAAEEPIEALLVASTEIRAYLAVSAIENVERTVVLSRSHVVNVILHLHLDAVAFVVLAAFELLVSILLRQARQRPLLDRLPISL